jgi:hypothetical protein
MRRMPTALLDVPGTLVDLDATFLPVAQMRQISHVTALDGPRTPRFTSP